MTARYQITCPACAGDFTVNTNEEMMFLARDCPYCGVEISVFMGEICKVKKPKGKTNTPPTLGISVSDGVETGEQLR